ncbi:protein downstream neighbor of son homolog [Sitophilus oryzae]|uniref:Protein downstream neighbor of son homolog n=1 Tax=Sitophilus oryzae TaxID=7048 RepID=A0A6J2YAA0_SITOR|nr:protein downstream neighbor of son homolog [Sitophilus oryzae]
MQSSPGKDVQWQHPNDVLKLHKLKLKKKALQQRINGSFSNKNDGSASSQKASPFENVLSGRKRKNPFEKSENVPKKARNNEGLLEESTDQTLFKLLNQSACDSVPDSSLTSFNGVLARINELDKPEERVEVVKATGKDWCPIDWCLRRKMRLISLKPFPWNQKLKISEEASGITSFTRCLDMEHSESTVDVSPNSKFHQCCLYWQHPSLPWLQLFPRTTSKVISNEFNLSSSSSIKNKLHETWTDSFRSLFQLIRTRQCPYFYVCANSFTVLFRAAGLLSYTDVHVIITPTTRGFRHMLRQEEIEFTMPLKKKRASDQGYETQESESGQTDESQSENNKENDFDEEDTPDEEWLKTMGINSEDIKQINYTQARIVHKTECEVDNSEQSLVLIEGVEVNAFFNFLINCKSIISPTGALAGVPPTLLAPVSFHGATLNSLRVRENKIHDDGTDYFSLELIGPILPTTIHNLLNINSSDHSMTMVFSDIETTRAFTKVRRKNQRKSDIEKQGTTVFSKENLSDCGLNSKILKSFCSADPEVLFNLECLKYCGETQTFTWT